MEFVRPFYPQSQFLFLCLSLSLIRALSTIAVHKVRSPTQTTPLSPLNLSSPILTEREGEREREEGEKGTKSQDKMKANVLLFNCGNFFWFSELIRDRRKEGQTHASHTARGSTQMVGLFTGDFTPVLPASV